MATPNQADSQKEGIRPREKLEERFASRVLAGMLAISFLWVLYEAREIILLGFAGLVIAVVLGGTSKMLADILPWPSERKRYTLSLWLVSTITLVLIATGCYLGGPRILSDLKQLSTELPDALRALRELPPVETIFNNGEEGISSEQMASITSTLSSAAKSFFSGTIFALTSITLVIFIAIFGAAQPELYLNATCSFFTKDKREHCDRTLRRCFEALWNWLKGQGVAMLIIGVLSIVGLHLIDVRYALTLGLLAGIFQFVPYLGPVISAVPALLVALTMSPQTALWVALLYLGIQFAEGNFITPMVMKRKANLPPLVTLFNTVLFGVVFGLIGVIVATPLSVILLTLKHEVYEKRVLRDLH